MASLKGLALWAQQNQVMGDALLVNVGGVQRCMVAEMAPNVLSGGQQVPQLRFICDGYCGLVAKKPSKQCRTIDRQMVNAQPIAQPPGLVQVFQTTRVTTPYRSGGSGLTTGVGTGNVMTIH